MTPALVPLLGLVGVVLFGAGQVQMINARQAARPATRRARILIGSGGAMLAAVLVVELLGAV